MKGQVFALAIALSACARADSPHAARAEASHSPPPVVAAKAEAPATTPGAPRAPSAPEAAKWPPDPPGVETKYCLEGVVEALAEDACYFLPEKPTTTLLIYLPGLMPPNDDSPEKRAVETVVANASRRAGVAALIPRGPTRSEMAPSGKDAKGMGSYRSWPTEDGAYGRFARRLADRITAHRRALEALTGAPFSRVFLGGSSAGAYFVGHLALRGDFPADGYLVLSGGSSRPAPKLGELPKRPIYIGYGDGDVVGDKAQELAAQARKAGWEVRVAMHHTGHGAREVYLDEGFAMFGVQKAVEATK